MFQYVSILVAEDGQQHLAAQFLAQRIPVDIEIVGMARRGTVLEHVKPPAVVGLEYAHVVRHDIDHQRHPVTLQRLHQRLEVIRGADLEIQ